MRPLFIYKRLASCLAMKWDHSYSSGYAVDSHSLSFTQPSSASEVPAPAVAMLLCHHHPSIWPSLIFTTSELYMTHLILSIVVIIILIICTCIKLYIRTHIFIHCCFIYYCMMTISNFSVSFSFFRFSFSTFPSALPPCWVALAYIHAAETLGHQQWAQLHKQCSQGHSSMSLQQQCASNATNRNSKPACKTAVCTSNTATGSVPTAVSTSNTAKGSGKAARHRRWHTVDCACV